MASAQRNRFPSRVVVVDGHRSFSDALSVSVGLTADMRVVATAADASEGMQSILAFLPELVVTEQDLSGPMSGLGLCRSVRCEETEIRRRPTPIVVLTSIPNPGIVREAELLERVTVSTKRSSLTDIVRTLRAAVHDEPTKGFAVADPFGLSPGELEVLTHLADGANATTIARQLCLSVHAIRGRIRGLLEKTGSTSQLEALVKSMRAGIIAPPAFEGTITVRQ